MTNRETRPFNIDHWRAGAPIDTERADGKPAIFEVDATRMFGTCIASSGEKVAQDWDLSGNAYAGAHGPRNLVMVPLFYIGGKPVFVGDEIMNDQGFIVKAAPGHDNDSGQWRWPAAMVKTKMNIADVAKLHWECDTTFRDREWKEDVLWMIDHGIARSIADGDVIPAETHRAALLEEHEKAKRLRGTDHFMDIDEVGAHLGRIYGSKEAIECIRKRFAETQGQDEKLLRLVARSTAAIFWNAALSDSDVDKAIQSARLSK